MRGEHLPGFQVKKKEQVTNMERYIVIALVLLGVHWTLGALQVAHVLPLGSRPVTRFDRMPVAIKACALGILTSAAILFSRLHFGLDGDLGIFIILASLPTTFVVRHLPLEYHSTAWLLASLLCGVASGWSSFPGK
jgi:hypothetical protein